MNSRDFNAIVREQLIACETVLFKKAGEYATDDDRLHNFKIASALQGLTVRQALAGMMAKHTISIYDMAGTPGPNHFAMDYWDEKITDHVNYLLLLKAVVVEEWLEVMSIDEERQSDYIPKHSKGS